MKKIAFLILAFIPFVSFAQKVELDTLFYDKDWKGVETPQFASFYRIYNPNTTSSFRKIYRDFYITGELQCEGSYISINKFDDSKSVFDGEYVCYFKSGAIEQKGSRVNGFEQGEYIRYYESGNIAIRVNMLNGEPHGLYTEFTEDGLCIQQEYNYGKPIHDYIVISNSDGLYSKLKIADQTPVFSTPSQSDMKVEYKDGAPWQYYINDGICVMITCSEINDYGKYYRMYVNFTNNTFHPIDFDPIESTATLTNNKGEERTLEIQTAEQYDKRIRRTQMWEEALVGFAEGLAASSAGYSRSTTTSTYSGYGNSYGSAYAYGSGGYAYGSYSGRSSYYGSGTSTTTTYDAGVAYQAQLVASQRIANFTESNFAVRQSRNEGYLKKTTVYPGESISGYFNIKRKKGESLVVTLNIAGIEYNFPWNVGKE